MFAKEREVLEEISKKLASDSHLMKIIAYGSRVRGDFRGDSDLDVLVVVDKKDREIKDKVIGEFYSYELKTDISFALSILSKEEFELNKRLGSPFIKAVANEGMIFYDSER